MAVIENLDIVLGARTEKLDRGFDRGRVAVNQFKTDVGSVQTAVDSLLQPLQDFGRQVLDLVPGGLLALNAFQSISTLVSAMTAAKLASEVKQASTAGVVAETAMVGMAVAAAAVVVEAKAIKREVAETTALILASRGINPFDGVRLRALRLLPGPALNVPRPDVIDADFRVLEQSPQRVAAQAASASSGVAQATRALGGLTSGGIAAGVAVAGAFVAVAGAAVGAALTIRGVRQQMEEIDQVSDAAKRLGLSFAELQTMRFTLGESSGLDTTAIDAGIQRMQLNLQKAAGDMESAVSQRLRAVGLDAGELLKAGPVSAMQQLAAATQQMKSPTDQLVLAYELFGKQGVALVNSLREGPDAMRENQDAARQLGLTLTNIQAEQVGAANDAWGRVAQIPVGVFRQIAAEVSPLLTVIADEILDIGESFSGWQEPLPTIVDAMAGLTGFAYDFYELSTATYRVLYNIATLDFSGVGESLYDAFDFSSAEVMINKVAEARKNAEAAASIKTTGDTDVAQFEANAARMETAAKNANKVAREKQQIDERNRQSIRQTISALQDEITALRLGANAVEQMKLARQGATQQQLQQSQALMMQRDQLQAFAKQIERAKELREEFATPQQKLIREAQELRTLLNVGAIDFQTFTRATAAAIEQFKSDTVKDKKEQKPLQFSPALQKGSVAAFSAAIRNEQASKNAKEQERLKQLAEQQAKSLISIDRKLDNLPKLGGK
jgi:hypothetical protein